MSRNFGFPPQHPPELRRVNSPIYWGPFIQALIDIVAVLFWLLFTLVTAAGVFMAVYLLMESFVQL